MLVDHEKPVLSDRYIVKFVHDATKNYYEIGKYGYWSSHVTKTPLFLLQVLKLHLLCLPMLLTLCSNELFSGTCMRAHAQVT